MAGRPNWERLARYINDRMSQVSIHDQADLIRASKLSPPTARALMSGEPRSDTVRPKSLKQLDAALQWEYGSAAAILAGGEPVLAAPSAGGVSSPDAAAQMEERLRVEIGEVDARVRAIERTLGEQLAGMVAQIEALADRLDERDAGES